MRLIPASLRRRACGTALLAVAALLAGACRSRPVAATDGTSGARLHAVLINGGGNRGQNYQSHFLHVQHMYRVLLDADSPPPQS